MTSWFCDGPFCLYIYVIPLSSVFCVHLLGGLDGLPRYTLPAWLTWIIIYASEPSSWTRHFLLDMALSLLFFIYCVPYAAGLVGSQVCVH